MHISFSQELVLAGCGIVVTWLLVRLWYLPRTRRALTSAGPGAIVDAGTRYGLVSALASVLDAMLAAAAIVAVGSLALQWHLARLSAGEAAAARVLEVRDRVERAVDATAGISAEVWAGALALLAVIWLIAARSSSRRRWNEAVSARRSALAAALATLSGEDLRARAVAENDAGVRALDSKIEALVRANRAAVAAIMSSPILQIGDDTGSRASLSELEAFQARLRRNAEELHAGGETEQAARFRATADGIKARFDAFARQVKVEQADLDGNVRTIPLWDALNDGGPSGPDALSTARDEALRKLVVDAQLAKHAALGASKARREPELIREWVAAGATSEAVVKASSFVGRTAARTAIVALLVGLVGLGVKEVAPAVISEATALELRLAAQAGRDEILAAMKAGASGSATASDTQLASDEATAQVLRQAFRSHVAAALRQSPRAQTARSAREHFELGAIEARQRILAASARSAAPGFEQGRPQQVFRPGQSLRAGALRSDDFASVLDAAITRRIEELRRNERVWTRLRAAAARPAPADLVGEAFLRTAFVQRRFSESPALRAWVERTADHFAAQSARTGRAPGPGELHLPPISEHPALSLRDRRLFGDYMAEAPERVAAVIDDVHSGRADPGSLHRELPGSPLPGSRGAREPYSVLFPPSHGPPYGGGSAPFDGPGPPFSGGGGGAGGGGGGIGGGGGGRTASAPTARSYARIRFSARVGGVVIGVGPTPGGEAPDIRDFAWRLDGARLRIVLTDAAGKATALGPFHAAIVHHALAYAADGRVVTATMPLTELSREGPYLPVRRVVVHPAIEDTRFACRAIEVDRFVDAFTQGDERVLAPRYAVANLGALLARPPQPDELTDARRAEGLRKAVEGIAHHVRSCGTGARCFPIEAYSRYGFRYGGAADFLGCLAAGQDGMGCVARLREQPASSSLYVDSGVREAGFKLDKELSFLTGAGRAGNPLWPLEFIIQAVPQTADGRDVDAKTEWEPWTFPSIDSLVSEDVVRGVAATPPAADVLAEVRDFAVLQRLFRLALAGDLGLQFPLDNLVRLQQATAGFVKVERNDRWNRTDTLITALGLEHNKLVEEVRQLGNSPFVGASCRAAASAALTMPSLNWPQGDGIWGALGNVEQSCRQPDAGPAFQNRVMLMAGSFLRERLAFLRDNELLDEAIGISQPRAYRPFVCSPL